MVGTVGNASAGGTTGAGADVVSGVIKESALNLSWAKSALA